MNTLFHFPQPRPCPLSDWTRFSLPLETLMRSEPSQHTPLRQPAAASSATYTPAQPVVENRPSSATPKDSSDPLSVCLAGCRLQTLVTIGGKRGVWLVMPILVTQTLPSVLWFLRMRICTIRVLSLGATDASVQSPRQGALAVSGEILIHCILSPNLFAEILRRNTLGISSSSAVRNQP